MKFSLPSPSSDLKAPSVYMEKSWPEQEVDRNIETPSQLLVSHVIQSPSFVRKSMKSWITRGSSGRRVRVRVNFLPGTTFSV